MITLRRAKERHHDRSRARDVWLTFRANDDEDPLAGGFGALEGLTEARLPPGTDVPRHPSQEGEGEGEGGGEVVTYVREGSLAYQYAAGRAGVVRAGEFQRKTAESGVRRHETNPSRVDVTHLFQIWLRAGGTRSEPGNEQKRFSLAERRGGLCVVASPNARRGSLRVNADAVICSAVLDPGQHVVHELLQGRKVWLHLVSGEVILGDVILNAGDGVGVTVERAVSLTARVESEILLVDLGQPLPS